MQQLGLNGQLVALYLDMYQAPRAIKLFDAVGSWRVPASGLVPGCPAATFLMGLVSRYFSQGTSRSE